MIHPEVYFDINARMTERGYLLTSGSLANLSQLGLTPSKAVGMKFTFNGGNDVDNDGTPVEVIFDGTIEWSAEYGYLAVTDDRGIYLKPKR
ncbi:MAG: hypothetical protein VXW65_10555 [Pseudomonadota bacterium]|nr:hypothetical protein [Pseudomonadota bacterium]